MSHIHAYQSADVLDDALDDADEAPAGVSVRPAARSIAVEVADADRLAEIRSDWIGLMARTDAPNVFLDPVLLRAAADSDSGVQHRALLAWKSDGGPRRLAGIWAFSVGHAPHSLLPMRVLCAPSRDHAYLSSPMLDTDCADETIDAMLDCVAADSRLPNIAAIEMCATDGAAYGALMRVLARRGSAPCILEQSRRPKLASTLDGKAYLEKALSGSTRKKLRQYRRRLSEKGALTSVIASAPQDVRIALEEFLAMEAAGWKGRQGTAMLNNPADAAFMRGAVGALADLGCASIHALHLDGKPVSMQIVARSGAAAFTWKTTYDEAFQDFSPGTLLLEDYTAAFLADKSIAYVDSCSFDDTGFMSVWDQRLPFASLWIDARRGGSMAFRICCGAQKTYLRLRAAAKRGYLKWHETRKL